MSSSNPILYSLGMTWVLYANPNTLIFSSLYPRISSEVFSIEGDYDASITSYLKFYT